MKELKFKFQFTKVIKIRKRFKLHDEKQKQHISNFTIKTNKEYSFINTEIERQCKNATTDYR